jgi:hypothetical protein
MAQYELTPDEWQLVQNKRQAEERNKAFNEGISRAIELCNSYAAQCCGGSGQGGEAYKIVAQNLERLYK